MTTPTEAQLKRQLDRARANGLLSLLKRGAEAHELPLSFVLAVASRETNIVNMEGDYGHGKGVMQVDERYHDIAQGSDWKTNPGPLVNYACQILADHLNWARHCYKDYSAKQYFKIAAAAYNCGRGGVLGAMGSGDCDTRTTGGNYGKDVCERMRLFVELLKA